MSSSCFWPSDMPAAINLGLLLHTRLTLLFTRLVKRPFFGSWNPRLSAFGCRLNISKYFWQRIKIIWRIVWIAPVEANSLSRLFSLGRLSEPHSNTTCYLKATLINNDELIIIIRQELEFIVLCFMQRHRSQHEPSHSLMELIKPNNLEVNAHKVFILILHCIVKLWDVGVRPENKRGLALMQIKSAGQRRSLLGLSEKISIGADSCPCFLNTVSQ